MSYVNREQCVLYKALPRPGFLIFEYFVETLVIVFVGTFIAVWLSRRFLRFRRLLPRNPLMAFAYGSVLPVCSCGVIPLVSSLRERIGFTTLMAFVISAPLLSPYIIVLSFSVLGPTYGLLRIGSAFVLTMVCAVVLGLASKGRDLPAVASAVGCNKQCGPHEEDIYLETFAMFRRLLPYLLVAGALGVGLEYLGPRQFLLRGGFASGLPEVIVWTLAGVPLYFCNGAEVLFFEAPGEPRFPAGDRNRLLPDFHDGLFNLDRYAHPGDRRQAHAHPCRLRDRGLDRAGAAHQRDHIRPPALRPGASIRLSLGLRPVL